MTGINWVAEIGLVLLNTSLILEYFALSGS